LFWVRVFDSLGWLFPPGGGIRLAVVTVPQSSLLKQG